MECEVPHAVDGMTENTPDDARETEGAPSRETETTWEAYLYGVLDLSLIHI